MSMDVAMGKPQASRVVFWLRVPAVVTIIAVIQMLLPESVTLGPLWFIPLLELLGIPIGISIQLRRIHNSSWSSQRAVDVSMTIYLCFLGLTSALNAGLLLTTLLSVSSDSGQYLLFAGFGVLAINVLSFGLIYWWIDGGGPRVRHTGEVSRWDFQFPQQASQMAWTPTTIDYLFVAYTNIIAFSPTDTMPLTHRAKFLFTVQSSISLVTILVTVSRAINLIPDG